MDTPGLCDIEKRKQAAEAITKALKQDGIYKMFFIVTLEQGRLRPDDVTLLKMILESAPELTKYYLIINQVSRAVKKKLLNDTAIFNMLLKSGISEVNLPYDTYILDRIDEIDGESDQFIEKAEELIRFVRGAKGVEIHSELVTEISTDTFEEIREQMETKIKEISDKKTDFEKQVRTLLVEREEEKKLLIEKEEEKMRELVLEREQNEERMDQLKTQMSAAILSQNAEHEEQIKKLMTVNEEEKRLLMAREEEKKKELAQERRIHEERLEELQKQMCEEISSKNTEHEEQIKKVLTDQEEQNRLLMKREEEKIKEIALEREKNAERLEQLQKEMSAVISSKTMVHTEEVKKMLKDQEEEKRLLMDRDEEKMKKIEELQNEMSALRKHYEGIAQYRC